MTSIASAAAILPTASLFSRFGAAAASDSPSQSPTSGPSAVPTNSPTFHPTRIPTLSPIAPTEYPSKVPSESPSLFPTIRPTEMPTIRPTELYPYKSDVPTPNPSPSQYHPSFRIPTSGPTVHPTTVSPTVHPTFVPTNSTAVDGKSGNEGCLSENDAIAIGVVSAFVALGGIVTMAKKCCGSSPRGASATRYSSASQDRDNTI